jgi:hypothetical protein
MRWASLILFSAMALSVMLAARRAPAADAPTQPTELKILDAWTGKWTTHGKLYDTAHSKSGTIIITMTCGWSAYRGYMICDHQMDGPSGKRNDLSVYTYNQADKSYKFCSFDHSGVPTTTPLTIQGNIWSYDREGEQDGRKFQIKTINDFSKPGVVTWNTRFSADGGAHWTLMNEGVDTKE